MLRIRERKRLYLFRTNRFRADIVIDQYEAYKRADRPEVRAANITADIDRIKNFFDFERMFYGYDTV